MVSSPSTTSIRLQPERPQKAKVSDHPPCATHRPASPCSVVPVLFCESDHPLSTRDPILTPSREHRRSNRNRDTGLALSLSPSPNMSHRSPGLRPAHEGDGPRTSDLHPDLATIRWVQSKLSKKGNWAPVECEFRYSSSQISQL